MGWIFKPEIVSGKANPVNLYRIAHIPRGNYERGFWLWSWHDDSLTDEAKVLSDGYWEDCAGVLGVGDYIMVSGPRRAMNLLVTDVNPKRSTVHVELVAKTGSASTLAERVVEHVGGLEVLA